jgi:hypothetical protein
LGLIVEVRRLWFPLPPAVTALACTCSPNSTTATKLLPLVPPFLVPGVWTRAE